MENEELATRIQQGEKTLLPHLWEKNIGIFIMMSGKAHRRYSVLCDRAGVTADDVFQVCYFALLDAVAAYNPQGEYKLLSYIKFNLLRELNVMCGIRTSKRELLNISARLDEAIGEDDSDITRLDLAADPNSGAAFEECEAAIFQAQSRQTLETAIDRLPSRTAAVIRGRYFEGRKQGDVAQEMGMKQSYAHNLERAGLRKLSRYESVKALHDEILCTEAYHRTGFAAFLESGSSVENAVIKANRKARG